MKGAACSRPSRRGPAALARSAGLYGILLSAACLVVFPFGWMILTSLKTRAETVAYSPSLLPAAPQWANYAKVFAVLPIVRFFLNSCIVATCSAVLVTVTALLSGYALAQLRFPGRQLVYGLYVFAMMVPFEITLIPNFLLVRSLGWYDSYTAMVLPWGASAFGTLLVTQFVRQLPEAYRDAARVEGCDDWAFLTRVVARLAAPVLSTVGLLAFVGSWGSLLWPLMVTSTEMMRPLECGLLYFVRGEQRDIPLVMAAAAITMVPMIVLFLASQRALTDGITHGLKG